MKKKVFLFTALTLFTLTLALTITSVSRARTLVDNSGTDESTATDDDSDSQNNQSSYYKEASSAVEMRKLRRMGIGLQAAGALGLGGMVLDMNFTPQWGATAGFGGGGGFQAFEIQAKYVLAGDWIMPYAAFGYSRWSSEGNNGPIQNTNPPLLGQRLLNDAERASGQFEENLLYPALGLQYMQLSGAWAGTSIYAELTVLLDLGNFVSAPTGAFGVMYYF